MIFTSNALSVRFFAETEFWFSFIKVAAIVLFILIGGCAVFGVLPIQGYDHAPLFENFVKDGLFPNGWMPAFTTMLTVNFAFSGTELIGVTVGETKDPDKAIPKAIHTTLFRLVIFFIGSIVVMASLIPWQDAGVDESPFVLVFNSIGLPFAGDVMNFVVLTAILSAANSGLYVSTRMLWSLANEDMIPHNIAKTNSRGVPMDRASPEHDRRSAGIAVQRRGRFHGLSGIGVRVRFGRRDRVDGHRNLPDSVPQAVDRFRTYRGRTHLPHARISDCSVGRLHH